MRRPASRNIVLTKFVPKGLYTQAVRRMIGEGCFDRTASSPASSGSCCSNTEVATRTKSTVWRKLTHRLKSRGAVRNGPAESFIEC